MSLKVFHIIFIVVCVSLALFCAYWAFTTHAALFFGYASIAAAVALVIYGIWFFRKARNIIT